MPSGSRFAPRAPDDYDRIVASFSWAIVRVAEGSFLHMESEYDREMERTDLAYMGILARSQDLMRVLEPKGREEEMWATQSAILSADIRGHYGRRREFVGRLPCVPGRLIISGDVPAR